MAGGVGVGDPVDSIKDVVRSSVKVPEFNKHLKRAGGHVGRNVVEITVKMKTIVRKPLMIKNDVAFFSERIPFQDVINIEYIFPVLPVLISYDHNFGLA